MCGIAGWVDFAQDLTLHRETALAMTTTMDRRGPDAEGLWIGRYAALGHRRLSVIDLAGGCQPMTAEDGSGTAVVLSYSGEVYNFAELRAELRSRGHQFTTRSDTEVVLRAYVEWGAELVTRLEGIYAFAVWDEHRQELLLIRDRMGVKPLYYAETPAGVLFGSEPKAILAHPDFTRVLDLDGLRDILSVAKVPGRAGFRGMQEVPPGCLVRVGRAGTTSQRYWALRVSEHPDSLPETVATVRSLLEDIVAQQLVADVPVCTLLSGGLDSSTLTALAARVTERQGSGPIRSCSVLTSDQQEVTAESNHDYVYARMLAEHVGAEHTELPLKPTDLLDQQLRQSVLRAYDLPIAKGDEHASLHLLFDAIRQHSTVALSGECGDEVFGGYRWQRNPEAIWSGTFPWVHSGRHRYRGNELILSYDLMRALELESYERDCHAQAVAEIRADEHVADPTEARMREVTYLALTRHAQVLFDRKDRMSMACGLEVRVPFADHRLVEYTFNVPWAMKSFDGREKSLLRAAVGDLLPPAVAMRVKTPYPSTQDDSYDRALRQQLAVIAQDPDAPIAALLSTGIGRLLGQPDAGAQLGLSRASLETTLQLNAWLRDYDVRVAL